MKYQVIVFGPNADKYPALLGKALESQFQSLGLTKRLASLPGPRSLPFPALPEFWLRSRVN
jgi:hypothetical protein